MLNSSNLIVLIRAPEGRGYGIGDEASSAEQETQPKMSVLGCLPNDDVGDG